MKFLLALALWIASAAAWESNCGQSGGRRAGRLIVGGEDASPGQWPWQVSLRRGSGAPGRHFCGGVIINARYVLSAAHCTVNQVPSNIKVVVGEHKTDAANSNRRTVDVARILNHEWYEVEAAFDADISLLQLTSPLTLGSFVHPACKPEAGNTYAGKTCAVSGWGHLYSGGGYLATTLQYVEMPVYTNAECEDDYWPSEITAGMICAGDHYETDSCQGDSGGPMVVANDNGRYEIVGLVSWGFGCASGYPGVYARVTEYLDWIQEKIGA